MKNETAFDLALEILKSKRAKAIAAAQPSQTKFFQPSPQNNLMGENAGQSELSTYMQRIEAKQKEREEAQKHAARQEAYKAKREAMMQPGQQTLQQPADQDIDIQEAVDENQKELEHNMGFGGFGKSMIEQMQMLGMIQKADDDEKEIYSKKQKQLGDSYADAQMNPDHPSKTNPTSYDMHGNPIQGDREIDDLGAPCEHCGEGHTIYTDDGAVGCSTEDCIANTPEMLQQGEYPQYKNQQLTQQKVGEVTPTRTYQENKDKPPGGGLAGLFPMAPDPNFEPHVRINAMRPQQISQLVDAQGNPSTTMQGMRHPDIRTGEPMDIAMRLLKHAESPEAKKHKSEYDTKYESTPERRKYRTELTQERRKRGVAGKGGKDMSHTASGKIVPEDMHANRARHFKERGTLKKGGVIIQKKKLCAKGKAAAKKKYDVYPSAYANGYAVRVCRGDVSTSKKKSKTIKKNLNRWFKEKWVDVSRKDKDGKHPPCGRNKAKKSSKGYPKCRPSVKVSGKTPKTSGSMSDGQKRAATKRKRSKKQGVGGKPTIVR
jgi:hypothetical protein